MDTDFCQFNFGGDTCLYKDVREMKFIVVAFVAIAGHLCSAARPPLLPAAVLRLERSQDLKGASVEVEHLAQWDKVRHANMGLGGVHYTTGIVQLPLLGTMDNYLGWPYLTRVKIGNPSQSFKLLIDTGSDTVSVACRTCSNCPGSTGLSPRVSYDPQSSMISCSSSWCISAIESGLASCDPNNNCSYKIQYGSGGTAGNYVYDEVSFDTVGGNIPSISVPVVFGCSNLQSGALAQEDLAFDGILGLGPNQLSMNSQLNSLGVSPMVFSLCLKSSDPYGGLLIFGDAVEPGLVFTPLVSSSGSYYRVNLEHIVVDDEKLLVDPSVFSSHGRETIVDSGTTLAFLADEAYDPFVNAIVRAVSPSVHPVIQNGNQCFVTSSSLDLSFPSVSLIFMGGSEMVLKPHNYLLPDGLLNEQSRFCIGWRRQQGSRHITILGDIILRDKLIVHDLDNMRLGWVEYNCSQSVNVTTSDHWNKRQANSCHASYVILIPSAVVVVFVTYVLTFSV